jgi:heptosyltransferase II
MKKQKKILLARTDRLGDVVLTTPAIKAVRDAYPDAYIAMVVRPYTQQVVQGNPYLDEVIVYDKYRRHRSIFSTMIFALNLRKRGFDRAIIFHPTNRMHLIAYIANIPRRIGYDNKLGFLLTDRIRNLKYQGLKHEKDYTLDVLKALGIESDENELYMSLTDLSIKQADNILSEHGVKKYDRIVVMHPGASCASKIWPYERFAKLADMLSHKYGVKIVIVGGNHEKDIFCAEKVSRFMQEQAVLLSGVLDIGQLAAVLKRAIVFISNDSGPVHVAVAMGTRVIDIFARAQPGLSPKRWGPLHEHDIVIHRDVGCNDRCAAHNCSKGFACIRAIGVDDVYDAVCRLGLL